MRPEIALYRWAGHTCPEWRQSALIKPTNRCKPSFSASMYFGEPSTNLGAMEVIFQEVSLYDTGF